MKWQSAWGEQPEGITDDEYSYYVFQVQGDLFSELMPYKVQFVENPENGGIPLVWKGSGMYTQNQDKKSLTSWQPFSDDTYTTDWSSWRNLGVAYGYPYMYTVVAYPKEAEADGKEMVNNVTFRLQGQDHEEAQEAPASVKFKNTAAPFSYEGDKFSVQKATASAVDRGGINLLRLGKQSGEMQFICRTSMQCYDQTKDDEGNYGKRNWTAELIDDQLYLEGELLQPGDYEFTGFSTVHYTYCEIEDDPDRGTYKKVIKELGTNDDPDVTFSLYYRTSPDGEWILFDTFDKSNPLKNSGSLDIEGTGAMQVKWVVNSNAYSVYSGNCIGVVRLNPTEHVLGLLEGKTSATITNVDSVRAFNDKGELLGTTSKVNLQYPKFNDSVAQHDQEGGYGLGAGEYLMHDAATYSITATDSAMTLSKSATLKKTDDVNRNYVIEYTTIQNMTCGIYNATWDVYRELVGGNVGQTVIYDLLPEGMSYDGKGITVTYSGRDEEGLYVTAGNTASFTVPSSDVAVKQVRNWQGSGRTMLIATVQLPDEKIANPSVKLVYQCVYPWDSATDYGLTL
ncbi:MAG: hypothetical protein PUE49_08375 [Eggerthellales bacterium]|nr:hypothetical protein [Eggerthellales bacterium]